MDITTDTAEKNTNLNDSNRTWKSSNKRNREVAGLESTVEVKDGHNSHDLIEQHQSNRENYTRPLLSVPKSDFDSLRKKETVPIINATCTSKRRSSPVKQIFGAKSPLHLLKSKTILKANSFDDTSSSSSNMMYIANSNNSGGVSPSISTVTSGDRDGREDDHSFLNNHDATSNNDQIILPRRKLQRIESNNLNNSNENNSNNLYISSYHHYLKLPLLRKRIEAITASATTTTSAFDSSSSSDISNNEKSTSTATGGIATTNPTNLLSTLLPSASVSNSTMTTTTSIRLTPNVSATTSSSFSFGLQPVASSAIFDHSIPPISTDTSNVLFGYQSSTPLTGASIPSASSSNSTTTTFTSSSTHTDSSFDTSSSSSNNIDNGSKIDNQTHPQYKQDTQPLQLPDLTTTTMASSPTKSKLSIRNNSSSSPPSQGSNFAPFLFSQSPVAPPLAPGKPPPSPPTVQHRVGELSFSKGIAFLSSSRGTKNSEKSDITDPMVDSSSASHSNTGINVTNLTSINQVMEPPAITYNQDNKLIVQNSVMSQSAIVFPNHPSFSSNSFAVNTTATPLPSLPAPVFSFAPSLSAPPQYSFPSSSFATTVSTPPSVNAAAAADGFSLGQSNSSTQKRKKVKPRLKDR